ncbi:antibiotic biosynthesis monooxygenase [Trichocoleus sp. FACHB-69]|uniref:putative quinol monooxygenase n=1 Tax=Trichocoleus sp. FACHB-69 TaxID=2692874 RepID=UPI0028C48648|nr:antibiotic biosynthesis monooxygenase [Trichocoleus sp. FACHB-69]
MEPRRKENGCISYELLQNCNDVTDFTFVEDWKNDALLEAYLASGQIEETDVMNGLVAFIGC